MGFPESVWINTWRQAWLIQRNKSLECMQGGLFFDAEGYRSGELVCGLPPGNCRFGIRVRQTCSRAVEELTQPLYVCDIDRAA